MGLILDDHEIHAEARRESFSLYSDFGKVSNCRGLIYASWPISSGASLKVAKERGVWEVK